MRRVRASSGRRVAAVADVTAAVDTVGVVTVVSEEAATRRQALPADRLLYSPLSQRICVCCRLIFALRTAHATTALGNLGRAGFEPAKA